MSLIDVPYLWRGRDACQPLSGGFCRGRASFLRTGCLRRWHGRENRGFERWQFLPCGV